jgi:hypothetical protein
VEDPVTQITSPYTAVTGVSSGIGFDVTSCAEVEFDLLMAADRPSRHDAAQRLHPSRERGVDPG